MYGCESCTIKKSECWRIDAFDQLPLVLENNLQSLKSPLDCKEIQPIHPKGIQSWIFIGRTDAWSWNSNTLATWCEELTHWKRPWCWERLKAGGEGDDRGWDGWMASSTQWTWVLVGSMSWWWTGRPGVFAVHGAAKSKTRPSDWTELRDFAGSISGKERICLAMQETSATWIRSLGPEVSLKEGMETHSSILACLSHGQRSLEGYSPWGHKQSDMTEVT